MQQLSLCINFGFLEVYSSPCGPPSSFAGRRLKQMRLKCRAFQLSRQNRFMVARKWFSSMFARLNHGGEVQTRYLARSAKSPVLRNDGLPNIRKTKPWFFIAPEKRKGPVPGRHVISLKMDTQMCMPSKVAGPPGKKPGIRSKKNKTISTFYLANERFNIYDSKFK